jgi:DNA mismatch repair protein MutS
MSTQFQSILWASPEGRAEEDAAAPDCFRDLNLDQVLDAITAGREHYHLEEFFYVTLDEVDAVAYRHEVLHDLQKPDVLAMIRVFAEAMERMRRHLELAEGLHHELQRQSWFLDAVAVYCEAVQKLADELSTRDVSSRGVRGLRDYVVDYTGSAGFAALVGETETLKRALAAIRYAVHIDGPRVLVTAYEGDADYSAQVQDTFERFRQGAVRSYLVTLPEETEMDHVEARILEGVAELHPQVFGARAQFCDRHRDYLNATIVRFDREVQFYVSYLELVQRLRGAGLPFCYPRVSAGAKEIAATDTFDLALGTKLMRERGSVVPNDFHLEGAERIFVVSGPNNGGKTTFARMFGQIHHLAGLGLLVPGSEARLFLPDRIFTHFEREEDIETLRGKFDEELVRVHRILDQATPRSVIVMNESFNSTTLSDALLVGTEVMRRILGLGCLGVYVTFVEEIASLSEATVSMVTQIVPQNPAERTFKLVRRPADGLAYAWAIAEKYGLTYDRLMDRIAP